MTPAEELNFTDQIPQSLFLDLNGTPRSATPGRITRRGSRCRTGRRWTTCSLGCGSQSKALARAMQRNGSVSGARGAWRATVTGDVSRGTAPAARVELTRTTRRSSLQPQCPPGSMVLEGRDPSRPFLVRGFARASQIGSHGILVAIFVATRNGGFGHGGPPP